MPTIEKVLNPRAEAIFNEMSPNSFIPFSEVVRATGLGPLEVKRGLRDLFREGMITKKSGRRGSVYGLSSKGARVFKREVQEAV